MLFILYKSPNTGILFNGVLRPKLVNNPFACCSLINFDVLLPHIAQFDKIIVLALVVFKTFGFMLSVFFLHFKQMIALFIYNTGVFTCLFKSFILFTLLILSLICS